MTVRARYVFTVKEFEDGTPWIAMEPWDSSLQVLGRGLLGFDLKPGTTLAEAQTLAKALNDTIHSVAYTP